MCCGICSLNRARSRDNNDRRDRMLRRDLYQASEAEWRFELSEGQEHGQESGRESDQEGGRENCRENGHASFAWYELLTTNAAAARAFYALVVGWEAQDASTAAFPYAVFSAGKTEVGGLMELPPDARRMGAT